MPPNQSITPCHAKPQGQGLPPLTSPPRRLLPLFAARVSAGFPSPAEEYAEGWLDLNRYLVHDPGATAFVRVPDAALDGRGIREGDLAVVNTALRPRDGHLVWVELDGERLIREYGPQGARLWLRAHHPDFPPRALRTGQDLRILGVVTALVRALYPASGHRPFQPR